VDETDDLFITCVSGVTIRTHVKNIRAAGRATQGVKLINLDEGDQIAAIAKIAEQEEDENITSEEIDSENPAEENNTDNINPENTDSTKNSDANSSDETEK